MTSHINLRIQEEVIVTAQKRSESLQDIPVTLTAYTGESLIKFGVSDTQQIANVTPGLVFNNTGGYNQPYLRGVGTRFAIAGLEPTIASYVDDQYMSRPTSLLMELNDVERVEVLKGPQGTLFGRNAAGGAIRVITKEVSDDFEGNVSVGVGNYDSFVTKGAINIPVTDRVGIRLAAMHKERDGYVDNISTLPGVVDEFDDQDAQEYRAKIRWLVSDRTTAKLSLSYAENEDLNGMESQAVGPVNAGFARGGITATKPDQVASDLKDNFRFESESFRSALRLEHDFDFAQFTSITTYMSLESFFPIESDGTDATVITSYNIDHDYKSYSQEFQLASNSDSSLEWLLGMYYYKEDLLFETVLEVGGPTPISLGDHDLRTEAYAAFGQLTWHIDDQWSLTVGGRYSYEEKEVQAGGSSYGVTVAFPGAHLEDDWTDFSPKITMAYQASENTMAYLNWSRGFKSGGFTVPASGNTPVEPEQLDMYELGVKADYLDNRLRLNAAFYYYDYKDLQVTRPATAVGGGVIRIVTENAAQAKVYGLDFDLAWLVGDYTTLRFGGNIMESEYQDYIAAARVFDASLLPANGTAVVPFDAEGHSLLRAPDESLFVSISQTIPLNDLGYVDASVSYAWKGKYKFDFVADPLMQDLIQDSYGLLSARVAYTTKNQNWQVSLWGNNIADEDYFVDSVVAASGLRVTYGAPRTYGLDVQYNF